MENNNDFKEKILKLVKNKCFITGIICFIIGGILFGVGLSNKADKKLQGELSSTKETLESVNKALEEKENSLDDMNKELKEANEKLGEAKSYLDLSENQKSIVDEKIKEVINKDELEVEEEKFSECIKSLSSDKSYYDMSSDERSAIDEAILSYDGASKMFKEKYKDDYDNKVNDKKSSLDKINEEEKAKKEAEEAAKKQAEEAKKKEAEEKKKAEEQAKKEEEAKKYDTGLTWEDIARDGHIGEYCKFEGKVIQVINGSGFTQYRVAINGDYDTIMLIEISDTIKTVTLLEDDYIYFKGISMGTVSYQTVLGAEMTIPSVSVDEYSM